jgi:subtilase family serine protease
LEQLGGELDRGVVQLQKDAQTVSGASAREQKAYVALRDSRAPEARSFLARKLQQDTTVLDQALGEYHQEVNRMRSWRADQVRLEEPIAQKEEAESDPLLAAYRKLGWDEALYYQFDQLPGEGQGQKIALIDFDNSPTITQDLAVFDNTTGIGNSDFTFQQQTVTAGPGGIGYVTIPQTSSYQANFDIETHIDVEWAHYFAPKADILLVSAANFSSEDAFAAVQYAVDQGATQVSMSFGFTEGPGERVADPYFAAHPEVTFIAAAGDYGMGTSWPSVSPYVVAVGGTNLNLVVKSNAKGTHVTGTETAWNRTGGGISVYEPRPTYQMGWPGDSLFRTVPDLALNAAGDGYPIFDSNVTTGELSVGGELGWANTFGTSDATAVVAALSADLNTSLGKDLVGMPGLLYQLQPPALKGQGVRKIVGFRPITQGSNNPAPYQPNFESESPRIGPTTDEAGPGYNTVTGLGSPKAGALYNLLLRRWQATIGR